MKFKDFLKGKDTCRKGRYITDGALLIVKRYLKLNWLEKQKIKNLEIKELPLKLIPYESGEEIVFHSSIIRWGEEEYMQIRDYAAYTSRPVFFQKKYIDFIEKYIDPDTYTLVDFPINPYTTHYAIKLWKNGKFCGWHCECLLNGINR
ncbi:MAG: hypothetical protein NC191_06975 [Muribaculaceae bacterium]|nr:hypothetical protein [Muribaculaceae bacterium]